MKSELIKKTEAILYRYFDEVTEPAGGKGYRVEHAMRVKNVVAKFAKHPEVAKEDINLNALLVAALLHDIGDIKKVVNGSIDYSVEIDHPQAGAEVAKKELGVITDDQQLIEKVSEIILNHHNYGGNVSIETKLLQDSDQIDELGVLNFFQMFQFSYHKARNLTDTLAYWHMDGIKRKEQCVAHCNFDFTRKLARQRLTKMKETINEIEREISA